MVASLLARLAGTKAALRRRDKTKNHQDTIEYIFMLWNSTRRFVLNKVRTRTLTAGTPLLALGPLAMFGRWVSSRFLSTESKKCS